MGQYQCTGKAYSECTKANTDSEENDCGWCTNYHNVSGNDQCINQYKFCKDKSVCSQFDFSPNHSCDINVVGMASMMIIISLFYGMCTHLIIRTIAYHFNVSPIVHAVAQIMPFLACITLIVTSIWWVTHYESETAQTIAMWSIIALIICPLYGLTLGMIVNVFINMAVRVKIVVKTSGNRKCLYFIIFIILAALCALAALGGLNLGGLNLISSTSLMAIGLLIADVGKLAVEFNKKISVRTSWRNIKFILCNIGTVDIEENPAHARVLSVQSNSYNSFDDEKKEIEENLPVQKVPNEVGDEHKLTRRIWVLFGTLCIVVVLVTMSLLFEKKEQCFLNVAALFIFSVDVLWWKHHTHPGVKCIGCLCIVWMGVVVLSVTSCITEGDWDILVTLINIMWWALHNFCDFDCE
eukprot:17820_1